MQTQRSPIVTVLGHVDHGKTTLLDALRKTNVASREAGGITQSIGASIVTWQDTRITFIDTPGHAAFSKMRSRGANVADIALLIVAADDGVKPQTKEALGFIRDAKIPYIVVATKIDMQSAAVETVYSTLEKEGVLFEGRGGNVPLVAVSAKTGQGIDKLLEIIQLVADVTGIKADAQGLLEAVVIEVGKDNRGCLVSIVVRDGTLKVGDLISAGETTTKVRGLFDSQNKSVKAVYPGEPALILGFSSLPQVGSQVAVSKYTTDASSEITNLKDFTVPEGMLPIIVKVKSAGSQEALVANLPKTVFALAAGVGDVFESDVFAAKAANAVIYAFESKVPSTVAKLAETEGVEIKKFTIIYKLFEDLEATIESGHKKLKGEALVLAEFPFNGKKIVGCKVVSGKISRGDLLSLLRNNKEIGSAKATKLKKEKKEVLEVGASEEFGIMLEPQLDFKVGDVLISVLKK